MFGHSRPGTDPSAIPDFIQAQAANEQKPTGRDPGPRTHADRASLTQCLT